MTHKKLTPEELTDLCNTASKAWEKALSTATLITFTWKQQKYQSRLSQLRMRVETTKGELVAVRQFKPKPTLDL